MRVSTEFEIVKPLEIYSCRVNSGWQVRFMHGISATLFKFCRNGGKAETGGVLVGVANYKTKTIHVFELVKEPRGSKGNSREFIRGNKGLPTRINKIKEKTGQVIGYIGKWHTHPMNLEALSLLRLKIQSLIRDQ